MPQRLIRLDALLLAVLVIQLRKTENVQCGLQAIIIVEELNATSKCKHNVGVVLDGQCVDGARVFTDPISWASNPVISARSD
jgi:hypothetical protein